MWEDHVLYYQNQTVWRQVGDTRYARTTGVNWVLPSSLQLRLANLLKVTWLQADRVLLWASQRSSNIRVIKGQPCVSLDLNTHQQSLTRALCPKQHLALGAFPESQP